MEKPIKPVKPRIPNQPTKENRAYLYEDILEIQRTDSCSSESFSLLEQSDFSENINQDEDDNRANFYIDKDKALDFKLRDLIVDCDFEDYNLTLLFKRKLSFEKRNELYQKDLAEYNILSEKYKKDCVKYENDLILYKESSAKEKKEKKIKNLEKQLNDLKINDRRIKSNFTANSKITA